MNQGGAGWSHADARRGGTERADHRVVAERVVIRHIGRVRNGVDRHGGSRVGVVARIWVAFVAEATQKCYFTLLTSRGPPAKIRLRHRSTVSAAQHRVNELMATCSGARIDGDRAVEAG